MTKQELMQTLVRWLESRDLAHTCDEAQSIVRVPMSANMTDLTLAIECEGEPAVLQTMCALPVPVPESRRRAMCLLLNAMNQSQPAGHFIVDGTNGLLIVRVAQCISDGSAADELIAFALSWAYSAMTDALPLLLAFAYDLPELRRQAAGLLAKSGPPKPRRRCGRVATLDDDAQTPDVRSRQEFGTRRF
jgi:hypothetical protein